MNADAVKVYNDRHNGGARVYVAGEHIGRVVDVERGIWTSDVCPHRKAHTTRARAVRCLVAVVRRHRRREGVTA